MLIAAPWPSAASLASFADEEAERRIQAVIAVVGAVRSARSRYGVSPKEELSVTVKASADLASLILSQAPLIASLASVSQLDASPDAVKPEDGVVGILADMEVYTDMAGLVDLAHEREKLAREREKLARDREKLDKKLANPGFLAKAAPEIIEKDTLKRDDLISQLERIDAQLAQM